MDDRIEPRSGSTSRRGFLAIASGLAMSSQVRGVLEPQETRPDAEIEAVRERAEAVGLGPLRTVSGATHLVLGDAPEPFLRRVLQICEALTHDYLDHFSKRGFDVLKPAERLTVVALSSPDAFTAYLGTTEDEAVGGQYDLVTNRLVIFDNRQRVDAGPLVERANTVSLMHESMHQLTFNTGLLRRGAPIPLAINEGLGTYAESRRPDGRTPIGRANGARLQVLLDAMRTRRRWITTAEFLGGDDQSFHDPETVQQAYAQAWLLVFHLMQGGQRVARFRQYLQRLAGDDDQGEAARAAEVLGDLDTLDRDLQATLRQLARR